MSGSNATENQRQGVIILRLGSAYASAIIANSCLDQTLQLSSMVVGSLPNLTSSCAI